MNLPTEPSTMPAVRKYTRTFNADRTKVYTQGDQIKIQIPPIKNTYLTKNAKLYFDFDMSYNMYTTQNIVDIAGQYDDAARQVAFMFGKRFVGSTTSVDAFDSPICAKGRFATKPFPTLDINGPYGFFSRIQIHDYLGTTLLEDIDRHDILTAIMADFDLSNEDLEVYRPSLTLSDVSEFNSFVRKPEAVLPFNDANEFRMFMEEVMPMRITANLSAGNNILTSIDNIETKTTIPTYKACINLYSFLGRLSNKFVPLHNGFTITLYVNDILKPISFCNSTSTKSIIKDGTTKREIVFPRGQFGMPLQPSLISHSISNVYYKCDLLELPSELDSKVEKMIHSISYKYNQTSFTGTSNTQIGRLLPSLKSLRKTYIGQRTMAIGYYNNTERQFSFRLHNGLESSSLLYNKSVVNNSQGLLEHYESLKNAFGKTIGNYYNLGDFTDDVSNIESNGQQCIPFFNLDLVTSMESAYLSMHADNSTFPLYTDLETIPTNANRVGSGGKFLVVFDTMIPGSTPETIAGIDTSSNTVEYKLVYAMEDFYPCFVDIFMEHDAVIHVDPDKSTSVSF